jgi:hypothetical protein
MEVRIEAHVYSYYENKMPTYRIWVNDNLYTEREFWTNSLENFIIENIILEVEPGDHTITIEKVRPRHGEWVWIERMKMTYENTNVDSGFEIKKQNKQIINFKVTG